MAVSSVRRAQEEAGLPQSNPPFLLAQPSLPFYLNLVPVDSYIPNHPFNDPCQAVKARGNATQVDIRCGGPLVTQKLLYVVMPAYCDLTRLTAK